MYKLFFSLFLFLSLFSRTTAQVSSELKEYDGKYFKYTELKNMAIAKPLFTPLYSEGNDLLYTGFDYGSDNIDWINAFVQSFISVLKKYYTMDEIKTMKYDKGEGADASMFIEFDYYGNIQGLFFIFKTRLKSLLTDEKLYQLYQEITKLKLDTSGLYWKKKITPENREKIYSSALIFFFNKNNYPWE